MILRKKVFKMQKKKKKKIATMKKTENFSCMEKHRENFKGSAVNSVVFFFPFWLNHWD